jgi:hypothetical protein
MINNSKITSQSGINNTTNEFVNSNLFRGIVRLDDKNINQFQQKLTGYGFFFWTKAPPMFDHGNPELWTMFKNYSEKGLTTFDGFGNMTLETSEIMGGINGKPIVLPETTREDQNNFSMQVWEPKGSLCRSAIEWWMTGISDPETGYRHYHGLIADYVNSGGSKGLECKPSNHTAECIYIQTDETGYGIESASFFANVFPTSIDKSDTNFNAGDHTFVQLTLEFACRKYQSKEINTVAAEIVKNFWKIEHYQEFNPENLKAKNAAR